MKERRSREDYDLEPQAEREEGMKKYSESKKASARAGERRTRGEEGELEGKNNTLDTLLEIIMTGDDSVNLSVHTVHLHSFGKDKYCDYK